MNSGIAVDCSAIMGLCFEEERTDYHDQLLNRLTAELAYVPSTWLAEVGNVLTIAERRNRITIADSANFLGLLESLQVQVIDFLELNSIPEVMAVAREHNLTFYDSQYLHVALRNDLPLASLDKALCAASRKVGVTVF